MIVFENISKTYGKNVKAVRNLNLHIEKGEFVFVMGDSGSGKSTLIRLLLKEIDPTSGEITVDGENITAMKRSRIPRYRRKLGVVFQDFRLLRDRNVYENVAFAQRVVGTSSRQIRQDVPKLLTRVGLSAKYKAFPNELSGGEQQRVAIARALAKNPKLLLCDEPTGALDYVTGKSILKLLQDTCRQMGMTVVVITHNTAIAPMADKVIHIKSGRVDQVEISQNPTPVEDIEW